MNVNEFLNLCQRVKLSMRMANSQWNTGGKKKMICKCKCKCKCKSRPAVQYHLLSDICSIPQHLWHRKIVFFTFMAYKAARTILNVKMCCISSFLTLDPVRPKGVWFLLRLINAWNMDQSCSYFFYFHLDCFWFIRIPFTRHFLMFRATA